MIKTVHRRFCSAFMHLEMCPTLLCPELFKRLKQQTKSFDWPCHHQSWSPISEAAYHWCQGRLWLSVPSSSHLHNIVTHPICTKFITPAQYSHTLYPHQVHHTCTTVTHPICTKFITPAQYSHTLYPHHVHHTCTIQSHTLSVPSSSHLHNTVTHSICTKIITPAQYNHTPYLYQVHHTCTVQLYTLWSLSSNAMWLQSCVIHLFILTFFIPPPPPPIPPTIIYAYMPTAMKIDHHFFQYPINCVQ